LLEHTPIDRWDVVHMTIVACELPANSALDVQWVATAYFRDAYRAPLSRPSASVIDLFFGVFGHHPAWMKFFLIVRNRIASAVGLEAPSASDIIHIDRKSFYQVGDTIGVWPIYVLSDTELIAGRDNKHLDFRLSVLKDGHAVNASIVVSTVCSVHNRFGKVYLFFVVPFHRWGVQRLLARAVAAGRL
jgi:Protein of unknown function (DUF2867)